MRLVGLRARVGAAASARVAGAVEVATTLAAAVPGVTARAELSLPGAGDGTADGSADGNVRLTGRGLVTRAFGGRRHGADPQLAGLVAAIAAALSRGGI